jgi:hypothetical protein
MEEPPKVDVAKQRQKDKKNKLWGSCIHRENNFSLP